MGTREVHEEKLRTGNLYHDPTMNPGLGSPRCPRIAITFPSILILIDFHAIIQGKREWTITSVLHDATAVASSGAGAMLGAVHGFNTGIPFLQKHVKGPKWLHFFIGLPPLLMFSGASASFGTYAVPKFAQLTATSYYAASSASHCAVSQITRYVEAARSSHNLHDKPR